MARDRECRLGADVRRILVECGRAVGVEVVAGGAASAERAAHVVSDIGLANTLACLDASVAPAWREQAHALESGDGCVALYLGLEGDVASAGASSANHWIYESDDIGRTWQRPADEDAPGIFVSFPSLKDPSWQGPPTAEVVAIADRAAFAPWLDTTTHPADDYAAFKAWVAERLLAQFGRHFPALAPKVRFHEAATPLTQRRYARTAGGSIYGIEMSVERQGSEALKIRTPCRACCSPGTTRSGRACRRRS